MKVQLAQTPAGLAQAKQEALLLSQQIKGVVRLADYHEECLSSETSETLVFVFMPCVPTPYTRPQWARCLQASSKWNTFQQPVRIIASVETMADLLDSSRGVVCNASNPVSSWQSAACRWQIRLTSQPVVSSCDKHGLLRLRALHIIILLNTALEACMQRWPR